MLTRDDFVAPFVACPETLALAPALDGTLKAEFVWAYGIIWSRAFGLGLGDSDSPSPTMTMKFVPMLDVANSLPPHGAGGDIGSAGEVCCLDSCFSFGDENDGDGEAPGRRLVVRAAHAACSHEECFVSYGKPEDRKVSFRALENWV